MPRRGQDEEVDAGSRERVVIKSKYRWVPRGPLILSRIIECGWERGRGTREELAERVITRHGDVLILAHIVHSDLVYNQARPGEF